MSTQKLPPVMPVPPERTDSDVPLTPMGVWEWDVPADQLSCSEELAALLGISSREPMSGEQALQYIHPDDRDRVWKALAEIPDRGESTEIYYRVTSAGGTVRVLRVRIQHITGEDSETLKLMGFVQDTTDQINSERLLRSQSLLMRELTDAALIFDPQGIIHDANPAAKQILGWSRDELVGVNITDLWERLKVSDLAREEIDGSIQEHGYWRGEYTFVRRDGVKVAAEATTYPIPDEATGKLGRVSIIRDITERKEDAEALRRSQNRLQEANRIGRVGHWELDAVNWRVRMYGALYLELGAESDETEAVHGESFASLHEEDQGRVRAAYERSLSKGVRFDETYRIFRPDESICHVRAIGEIFREGDGKVGGMRGTIHDVTEQVLAEESLRESENLYSAAARYGRTAPWEILVQERKVLADENLSFLLGIEGRKPPSTLDEWAEHLLLEDTEVMAAGIKRLADGLVDQLSVEYRSQDPEGGILWMLAEGRVAERVDGQATRIVGTTRDITAQKAAEEAQRASEQRVSAILQNVADSVVTIDEGGVILSANQAFAETFGYLEEEVTGKDVSLIMPEPNRSRHAGYMGQYFETGVSQILGKAPRELEAVDKNGREFPIELMIGEATIGDQRVFIGSMRDISDRRATDEKLGESAQILDQMQDSVIATDLQGNITNWAGGSERIYGYSADEAIGKHVSLVYPEEDRGTLDQDIIGQFDDTDAFYAEGQRKRKSGEVFYSHASASVLRDGEGNVSGFLGLGYDVTERKRAEDALRESEERNRSIVAALSEGVIFQDAKGRIIDLNKRAEEILGYGSDIIKGATSSDPLWQAIRENRSPYPGEEHPAVLTLTTGRPCSDVVMGVFHPEKGLRWLEINSEPVFGNMAAEPVAVVVSFADVTDRKQAEQELRKARKRLSTAQRIAGLGAWEFDPATAETVWSEEMFHIFDLDPEENEPLGFDRYLEFIHPEDKAKLAAAVAQTLDAHEPTTLEYRITTKVGNEKIIIGFRESLFDEQGNQIGITGTLQDITAQRQAEQHLRQAQKMEAVGQLTGGMAHDFNNLLAVISGNLELAQERLPADSDLGRMLDAGIKASIRGAELTKRLLAFSRRQTLVPQPTDVNDLASRVLGLAKRTLGEAVEIVFEPAEGAWWAHVDAAQLENAVLNLAINARDAMPDGGTLTIRTGNFTAADKKRKRSGALPAGEYALIEVTDSGTGMSEDICEKVFEPFFTTKETGEGSGLGLSMVYGFIKQSNGHVEIESKIGTGTTIRLYLPRTEKTGQEDAPELRPATLEVKGSGETILIVEDDPHVREATLSLVESLGYAALEASDAVSALEVLERGAEVDLLLSDVVLGKGMNGVELANEVSERHPSTKILLMSGYAREAFAQQKGLGNEHELVAKPFRRDELARKIQGLLHKGSQKPQTTEA